jgi:hypothetical protein
MSDDHPAHTSKRPWFEPATVILMGAATLGTAWSSFQNSRWDSRSRDFGERADELARQSLALDIQSQQIKTVHFQIAAEIVNAKLAGDTARFDFYTRRLCDELKPAYEKWMAQDPFADPSASSHPFIGEFYTPRHQAEIQRTREESQRAKTQAGAAGGHATSHLANTVILSAVLLFAGTARTFDQRRVRTAALGFAGALFLYCVIRMLLLPVA